LDWFLGQKGRVKGFTSAIYTGFTTLEMSRIIELMLCKYPDETGVYQLSIVPLSKFDLLRIVCGTFELEIALIPDYLFCCDRSLESSRFRTEFNYSPPTWKAMIEELKE